MSAVTTYQTYITPADAQRLLDATAIANEALYPEKLNRAVDPDLVSEYAQTMLDGKWLCNGKTVVLDATGAVLNGQHRLLASIEADCGFETWVAQGVEREARYTIDSNTRTLEDILYMKGEENNLQLLASTLTLLARYEQGDFDSSFSATPDEILELLERHPEIRSHVELVYGLASWARHASIVALSYLGSLIDKKRAAEFIAGLEWCAKPSGASGQVLRKALKSLPHCDDPQMEFISSSWAPQLWKYFFGPTHRRSTTPGSSRAFRVFLAGRLCLPVPPPTVSSTSSVVTHSSDTGFPTCARGWLGSGKAL